MLYEKAVSRDREKHEFLARLHGFSIKDESGKEGSQEKAGSTGVNVCGHFYNGDPESVKHLPMEVREKMTQELMRKFMSEGG